MSERIGKYCIVTPCKNEEWNLPNLIKSVLAQTTRPALWVIVDDGSIDKSGEILDQLEEKYNWIKVIHLEEAKEYLGVHISYVYNSGFEFIKSYSKEFSIEWEYIGVLDADTIPEPEYFEKLIHMFKQNKRLGIASGSTCELTENIILIPENKHSNLDVTNIEFWATYPFSLTEETVRMDLPMGSARIWSKKCFEETGGRFDNINMPDAISTVKAKMKGWETARFPEIKLIERGASGAQGSWYGYKDRGLANYVVRLPFYIIILKSFNYSFKKPYYTGIAYMYGYFESFISKKERIKDQEVVRYYRSAHLNQTKKYYKNIIERKISRK